MKAKCRQKGFTLVEILVASAIILGILSMIYGTYFAVSESTEATKAKIALFHNGWEVLNQLSRQIRCSYAETDSNSVYMVVSDTEQIKTSQGSPGYFLCDPYNPTGEILQMVTTKAFGRAYDLSKGLFEVTYRFDKNEGQLYFNQGRFVATAGETVEKDNWQLILEEVESIKFSFFDGEKWLIVWDFEDRKKLPSAVRIDINLRNETHQTYSFSTVVDVSCCKNYGRKDQSNKLVVAKNK